nr:MAG TPA: hypothetical protein [Caudoviricetes sp.]
MSKQENVKISCCISCEFHGICFNLTIHIRRTGRNSIKTGMCEL